MSEKGGKDFAEMVGAMREVFNTGRTKTKMWRESQLRSLLELLTNEAPAICQALKKDLNKVRWVVNSGFRASCHNSELSPPKYYFHSLMFSIILP